MKKILTMIAGASLLALLATGCSVQTPAVVEVELQPEGAEIFGNYVAAGNSLTAGYMDGGLIMNGQADSYPQLIANQLGYPDGSFAQPLVASPGIGTTDLGEGMEDFVSGVLHFDATGSLSPLGVTPAVDVTDLLLASAWPVPYSNLGVPGATTLDVSNALDATNSQSGNNSYFDAILRNPTFGNVTMRDQLIARGPTIATLWIGNNDILGGATDGDPVVGVNLTPAAAFEQMYTALLDDISNGISDRHGYRPVLVTANVPGITNAPYFMVPATFNALLAAATEGAVTEAVTTETDVQFIRFPALGHIGEVLGEGGNPFPLETDWTLTTAEVTTVEDLVIEYNQIIADACAARQIPVYDANAALAALDPATEAQHYLALAGVLGPEAADDMTLFSLDGIHPNNKGYGVVANGFLATMNTAFGTEFPMVDLDTLTWDPTYGEGYGDKVAAGFPVSPAGWRQMDAIFR